MQILLQEHRLFLIKLLQFKVEFILIGGYAVIYHGYPRTTDDMDIWIKAGDDNKEKLLSMLSGEGILSDDLEDLRLLNFNETQCFHIGDVPRRIDFLTKVTGLIFDEAKKIQVYFKLDGYDVPVLHVEHLILAKMLSDRTKDKADVEELQKIIQLKKKNGL